MVILMTLTLELYPEYRRWSPQLWVVLVQLTEDLNRIRAEGDGLFLPGC
jgi:hypothetical protein